MKWVLIVSAVNSNEKSSTGGNVVTKRNNKILQDIFGDEYCEFFNVDYYTSKICAFIYNFLGFSDGLTPKKLRQLKTISRNFDIVFFNTTRLGIAVKKIGNNKKVFVFAHNFERDFVKQSVRNLSLVNKILHLPLVKAVCRNEFLSIKNCTDLFTLNERDSNLFFSKYGRQADFCIPISFQDSFKTNIKIKNEQYEPFLLFVGSDFWGNTDGLFWFIENVLDDLNTKLVVAGSGMDVYTNKFSNKKVVFLGFVDDLVQLYNDASAVILPIISGSGMKTKTAEALMCGKTIFGTTEAFEGYELDYDKVGGLCNSKDEFVEKINSFFSSSSPKFNDYSRTVFLEKYSNEAVKNSLGKYFESKGEFKNEK